MLSRADMVGSWAGLPVPWDANLELDEQLYRKNLERTCAAGAPGIYTAGSTGEFSPWSSTSGS